jgi:hypothetical protein
MPSAVSCQQSAVSCQPNPKPGLADVAILPGGILSGQTGFDLG